MYADARLLPASNDFPKTITETLKCFKSPVNLRWSAVPVTLLCIHVALLTVSLKIPVVPQ